MVRFILTLWAIGIAALVCYFTLVKPIDKTPLQREQDSVRRIYDKWKKENVIRKNIKYMQYKMNEDSIKNAKDSIFYLRIKQMDSIRRKRREG